MGAEAIMRALLTADAGVTALVGASIYPVVIPAGLEPARALVIDLLSNDPVLTIDGLNQSAAMFTADVQVTCIAHTYADVKALTAVVKTAAHLKRGSVAGSSVVSSVLSSEGADEYDPEQSVFLQSVRYVITYQ
ncbi:MAG: DUF3168 domain-containing protein [Gammaproteobacteria bacterium]|nr:DUF3168 domain-containing protein [Gammaproteobacteria bacterium]